MIISWLAFPVVVLYIISLWQPLFLPRYLIWTVPASLLLIALAIQLCWLQKSSFSRSLAIAMALYVVVFWILTGWQAKTNDIKTDLRAAITYIHEHRQPEDLLILQIPYLHLAYRYYTSDQGPDPFVKSEDRLGWWIGGPWTNNELSDDDARRWIDEELSKKTAGAGVIWVMQSESESRDSRQLMDQWLKKTATLFDEIGFFGVKVSSHRFDPP